MGYHSYVTGNIEIGNLSKGTKTKLVDFVEKKLEEFVLTSEPPTGDPVSSYTVRSYYWHKDDYTMHLHPAYIGDHKAYDFSEEIENVLKYAAHLGATFVQGSIVREGEVETDVEVYEVTSHNKVVTYYLETSWSKQVPVIN